MTPSSLVTLDVNANNPFAEIFVIDSSYSLVARGIARLKVDVAPGVLKIKTRLGRNELEQIRLVDSDTIIALAAPQQSSPIPTIGTGSTHEYQIAAAQQYSKRPRVMRGIGAEIFLMARQWSAERTPNEPRTGGRNPAAGITLLDGNRNVVANFGKEAVVNDILDDDPWAACCVGVDPGHYVLRTLLREGIVVEQTVFAPAGWQMQLFLLDVHQRGDGDGDGVPLSVLGNMSISMARLGAGFDAHDARPGEADLVRVAVTDGRPVFSNAALSLISQMIHDKFENPFLGIYGAHLMLMGRDYFSRNHNYVGQSLDPGSFRWIFDTDLFDTVIANLRRLVGNDHADVEALSLKCNDPTLRATRAAMEPPMLRRSWSLLVEASNDDPTLVSLALWERIAAMVPAGPFLTWKTDLSSRINPFNRRFARFLQEAVAAGAEVPFWLRHVSRLLAVGSGGSRLASPALEAIDAALPRTIRASLQSDAARDRVAIELDVPRVAIDSVLGSRAKVRDATVQATT